MTDCTSEVIGLTLLSLAFLMSFCLNVFFCLRRRAILGKDTDECCCPHIYNGGRLSQDEGHYFHNLNQHEQQENPHNQHEQEENPHNHHEIQENPIYGNISADRRGSVEVCYEMMTMQHKRDRMKPLEPDLNYASLDLKVAGKYKKKHRHQQGQNKPQDQLPVHNTPPANSFLEVEADMDAHLPSRDTSTMVSHSSIYLNSQQIAQEAEELERERGLSMEREDAGWEGILKREDSRSGEWKGVHESKERKNCSNGSVCTQLSELEDIQSSTDPFIGSYSHNGVQQD